eukprot:CAMPEP_0197438982 /NCGR_PEP_ID=MMETSP1175-20131217/5827_1 /TAXON_ID=1003142 /ORGANISM="Triceratium dubium, Strain CCMP147" /LENGTH=104 /DNA_ID=CAMNT_0042968803 /DNA_START=325 /DNA_END=636 /DNA_ORIENTATION=+
MYQCNSCGDCEVKNVGNCCGYYPKCVNTYFQPDLEKLEEWCANNDVSSVCGWTEIDACVCTEGRCEGRQLAADGAVDVCEDPPSDPSEFQFGLSSRSPAPSKDW